MIVSVYGKDGTGKTTITANLGVALAQQGKKVLIVDADLENPFLKLAFGTSDLSPTLHDLLSKSMDIKSAVHKVDTNIDILPGDMRIDSLLSIKAEQFADIVKEVSKGYDVVLLDCPGGLGRNAALTVSAGDEIIFITTPELTSITTVLKMKMLVNKLQREVRGTILNEAETSEEVTAELISELTGTKVISVVPFDPNLRKSLAAGRPFILQVKDSPASSAIRQLASTW